MSTETNGAAAPNDGGTPEAMPPDEAIDSTIQAAETAVVDTRAIKAEQEAAELRQQIRAQQEMIGELRKTTVSQSEMLSELVGRSREAENRGWAWAREDAIGRMRTAVKNADDVAFEMAKRDLDALDQHVHDQRQPKKPKDDAPAASQSDQAKLTPPDPVTIAWVAENPWINTDPELFDYALSRERRLGASNPGMSTAERLAKVKEDVVKRFPEKFPNQARNQPPAVSRPGPQAAAAAKSKPKAKTETDLPSDDRAVMERLVRMKVLTKDQYLKDYQWDK